MKFDFKNILSNGIYSYEFNPALDAAKGFDVYMYGECGGSGFKASTLYRFWSWDRSGNNDKTKQTNMVGGRFQRAHGKKISIIGSFRNHGDHVENLGKPYSLNYDPDEIQGHTYEFMIQNLKINPAGATGKKILGRSLIFIFEPDNNGTMTIGGDSYFSISRNETLTL